MKNIYFIATIIFFVLIAGTACKQQSNVISTEEKKWLEENPDLIVNIATVGPPFEFVSEQGQVVGMFVDYLSIIEDKIDYKFKRTYYKNFQGALEQMRNGEIDVMLELQSSPERREYMLFTAPLVNHPHAIMVKGDSNYETIVDLLDKEVCVVEKYAVHEYLENNYPDLNLKTYKSDLACLRALATGQVDAFICQQAVATYYLEKEGISNLRITGKIDYNNSLSIASRKDLPILHSILSKGVNSIGSKERRETYNLWISYNKFILKQRLSILYFAIGAAMLILCVVLSFIVILRRRVAQRTRDLLLAKEKAEESDRLKSAFLANMSHEIRTPMNGILGFTSLLKNAQLSGETQNRYIEVIQKSGDRMLSTVNDIIEISKIETGQVKLNLELVDLLELKDGLCDLFKHEAEQKNIAFECIISPHEGSLPLKTDKAKLTTILSNLLKNAVKFTESGFIRSSFLIEEKYIRFVIEDSGIGVAQERQDAIFNRFEQADIYDSKVHEGSGLGLAIAKSYVEMLGGEIGLESQPGKGSRFYFTLPNTIEVSQQQNTQKTNAITDSKQLRILVAEDDDVSYMHLSILLEMSGHHAIRACNGFEVLDALANNPSVDLVLMDLKMPGMNGYEATRKIRESNSELTIVAQTAFALAGDREVAMEAGCNAYLTKPIRQAELERILNQYV